MKRLVKYLFSGFVCSALLMGCEGQELQSNPVSDNNDTTVYEKPVSTFDETVEIFESYIDKYSVDSNNPNSINYTNLDYDYDTPIDHFNFTITMNEQVLSVYRTEEELQRFTEVMILSIGYSIYKDLVNINYFDIYDSFVFEYNVYDNGVLKKVFYCDFDEDYMSRALFFISSSLEVYTIDEVETMINPSVTYQQEPENVEPEIIVEENNNDIIIEEKQEETHEIYVAGYPAYYTSSNDGEDVLNIVIDNDCMQVADIEYYYNESLGAAMGCRYVVLIFGDGSNCVIENNGPSEVYNSYQANVNLSYYGS